MRKAKILVKENKEGAVEVLYKEYALEFVRYQEQAKQGSEVDAKNLNQAIDQLTTMKTRYKPTYHHPWKRSPGRKMPH